MFLIKGGINLGSTLSTVLDKFSTSNGHISGTEGDGATSNRTEDEMLQVETILGEPNLPFDLHFHASHGKAITLSSDSSVASRDERYFEHSIIFSHRPIRPNETIAVEVLETSDDFHGPLRIGFTTYNPDIFKNSLVPLGRDLKSVQGFWIKGVQLFAMTTGTVIYFKVDQDGTVLYGVDGENGGVFMKDIDVSQPVWAILEAYGTVQSLQFVAKKMLLIRRHNENYLGMNGNSPYHRSPSILARRPRQSGRIRELNLPLNLRRNVCLSPLQNIVSAEKRLQSPTSPSPTSGFSTPSTPSKFSPGLCIICTEREKNTAFTKCGHVCMCLECAEAFKTTTAAGGSKNTRKRNLCPVCRRPITSTMRVYF